MNALTQARAALVARVEAAELTAHGYMPERLSPPCVLVLEGMPYLTPSSTSYGDHTARYTLHVVTGPGDSRAVTEALDQLLATTVVAIEAADDAGPSPFDVTEAGEFYALEANGTRYLACPLTVTTDLTLTTD